MTPGSATGIDGSSEMIAMARANRAPACVVMYATTHAGVDGADPLPLPRPPRAEIDGLIGGYLGNTRRVSKPASTRLILADLSVLRAEEERTLR